LESKLIKGEENNMGKAEDMGVISQKKKREKKKKIKNDNARHVTSCNNCYPIALNF
jgi:hypothetical protein